MGYGTKKTDEITKQGNVFNGVEQLVKTDASGKLPLIDGSQLTGIPTLTDMGDIQTALTAILGV